LQGRGGGVGGQRRQRVTAQSALEVTRPQVVDARAGGGVGDARVAVAGAAVGGTAVGGTAVAGSAVGGMTRNGLDSPAGLQDTISKATPRIYRAAYKGFFI
jgi:hypothetical protein